MYLTATEPSGMRRRTPLALQQLLQQQPEERSFTTPGESVSA